MNSYATMSKAFKRFYSLATVFIIEVKEEISSITIENLHFHQNQSIQHASHAY